MSDEPAEARRGRRAALRAGASLAAGAAGLGATAARGQGTPPPWPASMLEPGAGFSNRGVPGPGEAPPIRWTSPEPSAPGTGVSWTPLHELEGAVTPTALHFERHHAGVPRIDPAAWRLRIDGAVARPLGLDLAALRARRLRSRLAFVECAGNSNALWRPEPVQAPVGWLHGLVSMNEWTGVPLAELLDEAGPGSGARWAIAQGLDAAGVTVSLPLATLPPDAMVALYQNGEPLHAAHGAPARLVLPGVAGIAQVKWLGRLHLADRPALSRFDTVAYTELLAGGTLHRFMRTVPVKSVVTSPALGRDVPRGRVEGSGLAWSGSGRVTRVETSLDGGASWRDATLETPVLDRALTRFRFAFERGDAPLVVASRATDETGAVQPTRRALLATRGGDPYHHYNAVTALGIDPEGRVSHVHV